MGATQKLRYKHWGQGGNYSVFWDKVQVVFINRNGRSAPPCDLKPKGERK